MPSYQIMEQDGKFNNAIAAGATEEIVSAPTKNAYFNFLFVQNFDTAVDCQILLDSGDKLTTAANQGKLYRIGYNGGALLIEPEDGVRFKQIVNRNPHGATAQTVSTINIQWGYKKRIG